MESAPKNYSKNFKGDKIDITFDEFLQQKNVGNELLISPPLENKPITKFRNKTLIIDLNNELKDSTTYTLNFGDAIADNNEGNILVNYEFVVSTGNFLDSLSVTGNVVRAFDLKPTEDPVSVMLYSNLNDSAPLTEIPMYVGKTDKEGNFAINNIRSGTYNVFALLDVNSNLKYDNPDEEIAFADSSFVLDPSQTVFSENESLDTALILHYADSSFFSDSIPHNYIVNKKTGDTLRFATKKTYALHVDLSLFREETSKQYLSVKERPDREKLLFGFNRPLYDSLVLHPLNFLYSEDLFLKETSVNNDSIIYWLRDTAVASYDTLKLTLTYSVLDSLNHITPRTDTLSMLYREASSKKPGRRKAQNTEEADTLSKFQKLAINVRDNDYLDLNKDVVIQTEKPDFDFNSDSLKLIQIVDSTETPVKVEMIRDTADFHKFLIHADWLEGTEYRLIMTPGAFTNIYGNSNDSVEVHFSIRKLEYYGKVIMNITGVKSPVLIQLLDDKSNIVRSEPVSQDGQITFEYVLPRSYVLKVVFDNNKNGKWDTGNYLKKIQPEKVKFYSKTVDVRSNWDVELNWDIEKPSSLPTASPKKGKGGAQNLTKPGKGK